MWSFVIFATAVIISTVCASDFCAWNRGAQAINENNAGTYNMINGDYERAYDFDSGGQTAVWQGMPYYKKTSSNCFVPFMYLYRYMDNQVFPAVAHWVIAVNVGTKPEYGFAYCGPMSGVTVTDLASPAGDCDGNWMVGAPADPATSSSAQHVLDPHFKIMFGGCPDIACSTIKMCSSLGDDYTGGRDSNYFDYTEDPDGTIRCATYSRDTSVGVPNVYKASLPNLSPTNEFYFFFNPEVMAWAVHEELTETLWSTCELYKTGKGFTAAFTISGWDPRFPAFASDVDPIVESWGTTRTGTEKVYLRMGSDISRYFKCSGSAPTASPTATAAPVPTPAPVDATSDTCYLLSQSGAKYTPTWASICGFGGTPAPVVSYVFTGAPTAQTPAPTSPTASGTIPTVTPAPSTANPTDANGTGRPTTPNPTAPVLSPTTPTLTPTETTLSPTASTLSPTAPTLSPTVLTLTPTLSPTPTVSPTFSPTFSTTKPNPSNACLVKVDKVLLFSMISAFWKLL